MVPGRASLRAAAVAATALGVLVLSGGAFGGTFNWSQVPTPAPGYHSYFVAVDAASSSDVWAVGATINSRTSPERTFIAHWDGSTWLRIPSPTPTGARLADVAAVSSSMAWAVGQRGTSPNIRTLILRWDGSSWQTLPTPRYGSFSRLEAVSAISASNAWAVGFYQSGLRYRALTLHWNGTSWRRVANAAPLDTTLSGVSVLDRSHAWAVGDYDSNYTLKTVILRWNGSRWSRVSSPNPGGRFGSDELADVDASSPRNAWAVGNSWSGSAARTLVLRWNGTRWSRVPSPNPDRALDVNDLTGVTVISANDAWAVGYYETPQIEITPLLLHWNGTRWSREPAPEIDSVFYTLDDIAASSSTNVWSVGTFGTGTPGEGGSFALGCC
jgi:hypothetical protein